MSIVTDSLCRKELTCSAKRSTIDWYHWSRLTRRESTSSAKRSTIDWCHWSRLTDWIAHWRDRLWARHCSRLTSCMWMYDQIHWWVEQWERIDHRFDDVIEADSLRDLLIEIETSRSSRLISLIIQQIRKISCESEWTINSLIFDLVEWFQSFVYTRWSAHEFESFVYSRWISSREKKDECCCMNTSH